MELICPKCHGVMRQYERNGITIDQCDECRGIYLDRGELERLVSAEGSFYGGTQQPRPTQPQAGYPQQQSQPGYPQQQPGYPQYAADGRTPLQPQPVYPTRQHHGSPGSPDSPRRFGQGQGHDQPRKRRSFLENLFE
jgi:Zn-finger nucleic acid-binding protein